MGRQKRKEDLLYERRAEKSVLPAGQRTSKREDETGKTLRAMVRMSLLFDLYGPLLTGKKQRVMTLYHERDMSLSEIAEELGISRAAVYDSLLSSQRALEAYEAKLGGLAAESRRKETRCRIREAVDALEKDFPQIRNRLETILALVGTED